MRTIRYLDLAAATALALGAGAAMAQEGARAMINGSTYFNQVPNMPVPVAGQGTIGSGSSDVAPQPEARWWTPNPPYATPAVPQWTPGIPYNNGVN